MLDFDVQVSQEDTDLGISAGLDSGTVPQGRLTRESEQLITDFQDRVYDALA